MPDAPSDTADDATTTEADSNATGATADAHGGSDAEADDTEGSNPYIHRPGGEEPLTSNTPDGEREFGRDGWILVAGIVIAFLVVPALIYWRPPALPFEIAFLILPLLPAVLLALLAVWITTTT